MNAYVYVHEQTHEYVFSQVCWFTICPLNLPMLFILRGSFWLLPKAECSFYSLLVNSCLSPRSQLLHELYSDALPDTLISLHFPYYVSF